MVKRILFSEFSQASPKTGLQFQNFTPLQPYQPKEFTSEHRWRVAITRQTQQVFHTQGSPWRSFLRLPILDDFVQQVSYDLPCR